MAKRPQTTRSPQERPRARARGRVPAALSSPAAFWPAAAAIIVLAFALCRLLWPTGREFASSLDHGDRLFADFVRHYYPQARDLLATRQPVFGFFYSTFFAVALSPLGRPPLATSLAIWGAFEVASTLLLCVVPARRLLRETGSATLPLLYVLLCATAHPVLHNFAWGQVSVALTLAAVMAAFAHADGRRGLAAGLVALAASVKYYPAVVAGQFILRRDWRALALCAAAALGLLVVVPAIVLGPDDALRFQRATWDAVRSEGRPTRDVNSQYIAHVAARLTGSAQPAAWAIVGGLIAAASLALLWTRRQAGDPSDPILGPIVLLLTVPFVLKTAWPHYFAYLPFCQVFLLRAVLAGSLRRRARRAWSAVVVASMILSNVGCFLLFGWWVRYSRVGCLFFADALLLAAAWGVLWRGAVPAAAGRAARLLPLVLLCAAFAAPAAAGETVALTGGTVIDVSQWGGSTADLEDAVVVMRDGVIVGVGPAAATPIPAEATVVDCRGTFLVPGLVDGFAALNHQAYANAYLAMGVTSILGVDDARRGPLDLDSDPSPRIFRLGDVGYEAAPLPELLAAVDEQGRLGTNVLLVMYRVAPDQMGAVIERAHALGMAVIGELARTSYVEAARLGADAFVHTSRYALDLASDELRRGVEAEPFSDAMGSAKWRYYKRLPALARERARIMEYGGRLAAAGAALLPTFSLGYLDRPGHGNPWSSPAAALIDPRDVNRPADRRTGEHAFTRQEAAAYRELAEAELRVDRALFAAGCHYLAGSGTDVWGTLPGVSLHHELEALCAIGHTPRQALAAATSNFANVLGWRDLGEIAVGRRADVLVLERDPRRDVRHLEDIRTVFLAGRALDPALLRRPVAIADGQLLTQSSMEIPAELLDAAGHPLPAHAYLDSVEISDITYMSDGLRVVGHLIVPEGPGPFPCLIYNRGGNREFGANNATRVAGRLARYASWGYVVAASQYRGNAGGEGREEFGGADVDDVLNLIPLLGSIARADTSRLGMIGYSRGGLMTYLALTRSDRLDAAVIGGGVTDSFSGNEDRPEMEREVYAELVPDYWRQKEAALKARSPILWPEKLCKRTPILLLHGSADWRVNPTEGLRMAEALFACRHPFRFVFLEGADHGMSEFDAEVATMTRHWLDRYVRDRAPLPDLEPHGP